MLLSLALRMIVREAISSNYLKFRFPLVASDALSSEANAVIDFFFPEKPIYV